MKTIRIPRLSVWLLFFVIATNSMAQATFSLPKLPYANNALEPVISEQTMNLHYGKHLQGYITNLNKLIVGTAFEQADLISIVKQSDGAIFNNAGQTLNHNLYFLQFSATPKLVPTGVLFDRIIQQWGNFDSFKMEFENAGMGVFGSGWVWLAKTDNGELRIVKELNAGNPVTKNMEPLLGVDVWEHAYYLDYQNVRAKHLSELWKIIDWNVIEQRYGE